MVSTKMKDESASATTPADYSSHSAGQSARRSGMESSVLRFKNINFVGGKGKTEKNILVDANGKVSWGHVLAIMGPSGAGYVQTVLSTAIFNETSSHKLSPLLPFGCIYLHRSEFPKIAWILHSD